MKGSWLFMLLAIVILLLMAGLPWLLDLKHGIWYVEGTLLLSALLLYMLYANIVRPVNALGAGMDLLREQDYSSRLSLVGQRDADRIVKLFNDLMGRLKTERLKVREQNHFLDLLIEASPMGILSYGFADEIVMANSTAVKMLGENPEGKRLDQLSSPLAKMFMSLRRDDSVTVRLSDTMIYRLSRLSFMDQGYPRPFLLIETLTDEVRMAERSAYEKVIRVMGHEVNNSMASIRSLLDLLGEIRPWGDDDDLSAAVDACVHRAEALSSFITSYSKVVKIPPLRPAPLSLVELLNRIETFVVGMGKSRGVNLSISVAQGVQPDELPLDAELLEQVLINIVKNSIESIVSAKEPVADPRVTLEVLAPTMLVVTDNGPGISSEAATSLFTPFFSTKPSGQGLGLMFVAEILRRHGATFSLVTSSTDHLTRFTMQFPRKQ